MKLSFLFADSHHTLHLISGRVPFHKPTQERLEEAARDLAETLEMPHSGWDFVGALRNGNLNGPEWYEPKEQT